MTATASPHQATQRRILITSALPYANGNIHLGHMLEAIQADIWARFQRSRGHQVYYVCADDAHGTPIMLHAQQRGISAEALIAQVNQAHQADYQGFGIAHDHFSSTHSEANRELVERIYHALDQHQHIARREIEQYFDETKSMFLPDRFIKGTCPKCSAEDQYGDSCEKCGSTYSPTDLVNPRSVLSGSTPVMRKSEHFFFKLGNFTNFLKPWIASPALQEEVRNKLAEWFTDGLRDWDISRDAPYFGFAIPDQPGKYFYVWLDAPVGYMAAFNELCLRAGLDFDDWWKAESTSELYHFIGKDIIYFHTLFWPAMLQGSGWRVPTAVYAHGFVTVNGAKMSKSRGTFIQASTYLEHLQPDYLRYYFAAKLGNSLADIDLSMDDFLQRVNADLIGKLVNIASRTASFINKRFDNRLAVTMPDPALYQRFVSTSEEIALEFEQRRYSQAIRQIMALADEANRYVDEHKPWAMIKEEGREAEVHGVCTQALNLFRVLMTWLAPVIPFTARKAESLLGVSLERWGDISSPLLNHEITRFSPLLTRIESAQLDAMIEASKPPQQPAPTSTTAPVQNKATSVSTSPAPDTAHTAGLDLAAEINVDDFSKVDMRVARIIAAEQVEGADKLLRLQLDLGTEQRQVFAGIKKTYDPAQLVGRLTIMLANLKPRKMRFGLSEGMVLAAGGDQGGPFLLSPDDGAQPGMRIR